MSEDVLAPDLAALGRTLRQQFVMHLNASRGHTYGYRILNAAGKAVATKSVFREKKTGKTSIALTLDEVDHTTLESFLRAYRQKLRDEEWEAADPARRSA